jgi:hypothetical protein
MSRLESAIRRLEAQRDCLNRAAHLLKDLEGPVLELGLGNGRTYDHMRKLMPDRRIFVFERKAMAHPDSMPPASDLIEGDFRETIPSAMQLIVSPAALIHADIGSGDRQTTAELARWLGTALKPFCQIGTVIVSDQPLDVIGAVSVPLPQSVAEGRYQMQQVIKN